MFFKRLNINGNQDRKKMYAFFFFNDFGWLNGVKLGHFTAF